MRLTFSGSQVECIWQCHRLSEALEQLPWAATCGQLEHQGCHCCSSTVEHECTISSHTHTHADRANNTHIPIKVINALDGGSSLLGGALCQCHSWRCSKHLGRSTTRCVSHDAASFTRLCVCASSMCHTSGFFSVEWRPRAQPLIFMKPSQS